MQERRMNNFKSPDVSKLQEVVIDERTKIYVAIGTDPDEARSRYKTRLEAKGKVVFASRKPVIS